jgi:manganese-dependent inorganic pyrophosphatase
MTSQILVTSYLNPDLDGVASALAYAELLKSKGRDAEAILFGKPQPEVDFFIQRYDYHFPIESGEQKSRWDSYVIVDTSSSKRLPKFIDPVKVTEILDHHPAEAGKEFSNAKIQNEGVGAVVTLIYEKVLKNGLKLDKDLARLIYAGIFHNSNLLSNATQRDLDVIAGLEKDYGFNKQITAEMFEYTSGYILGNLEEVILGDLKEIDAADGLCIGGQVEVYDAFAKENQVMVKVSALAEKLSSEKKAKVFMIVTDLRANRSGIYTRDTRFQEKIKSVFAVDFNENWAFARPMVLRKKILSVIKS